MRDPDCPKCQTQNRGWPCRDHYDGGMMDQTMPDRPLFTPEALSHSTDQKTLVDLDGREWKRLVFGDDGVVAAEDPDGTIHVWDQAALFEAVFRRWGEDR